MAAVLAVLTPSTALAQTSAPTWLQTPGPEDLAQVYPAAALASGVAGRAVMRCRIMADGGLDACRAESEEPAGAGFGEAVLALASKFRLSPPPEAGAEIAIPVRFAPLPPVREVVFPRRPVGYSHLGPVGPYYPARAASHGVTGEALIDCRVGDANRLRECRVVGVTPRDFAFEQAAIRMAAAAWILAGPPPAGATTPADGFWRFRVPFKP